LPTAHHRERSEPRNDSSRRRSWSSAVGSQASLLTHPTIPYAFR